MPLSETEIEYSTDPTMRDAMCFILVKYVLEQTLDIISESAGEKNPMREVILKSVKNPIGQQTLEFVLAGYYGDSSTLFEHMHQSVQVLEKQTKTFCSILAEREEDSNGKE